MRVSRHEEGKIQESLGALFRNTGNRWPSPELGLWKKAWRDGTGGESQQWKDSFIDGVKGRTGKTTASL